MSEREIPDSVAEAVIDAVGFVQHPTILRRDKAEQIARAVVDAWVEAEFDRVVNDDEIVHITWLCHNCRTPQGDYDAAERAGIDAAATELMTAGSSIGSAVEAGIKAAIGAWEGWK